MLQPLALTATFQGVLPRRSHFQHQGDTNLRQLCYVHLNEQHVGGWAPPPPPWRDVLNRRTPSVVLRMGAVVKT